MPPSPPSLLPLLSASSPTTPLPSLHCSPTCRFSCPWTTPPCTSLSPLTWGCPCAAWRSSTNQPTPLPPPHPLHYGLYQPLQQQSTPLGSPPPPPLRPSLLSRPSVPRPSASCGTSCAWQVGLQSLFLSPSRPFIQPPTPTSTPFNALPPRLVTKAVYTPPRFFLFVCLFKKKWLHLHVFSSPCLSPLPVRFISFAEMLLCLLSAATQSQTPHKGIGRKEGKKKENCSDSGAN